MEIRKLVIPREGWGTGSLLRDDYRMCCLGHLGRACGVPDGLMMKKAMPDDLDPTWQANYPKAFRDNMGDVCELAAFVNDNSKMSRPEKEHRLKILFGARGIKLSFTGKHPQRRND